MEKTYFRNVFMCFRKCKLGIKLKIAETFVSFSCRPVHTNPFSNENRAVFAPLSKRFTSTLSYRFRPSTLQRRIRFKNAVIPSVRMLKWARRMRISIYRSANWRENWSYTLAFVRQFGYSRWSGLALVTVFRQHRRISLKKMQLLSHAHNSTFLWLHTCNWIYTWSTQQLRTL